MKVGGQLHAPAAIPPGKRPGTHCIEGWVGFRAGLDGCEKSLRYPGTQGTKLHFKFDPQSVLTLTDPIYTIQIIMS